MEYPEPDEKNVHDDSFAGVRYNITSEIKSRQSVIYVI
jgi:hypothetical protein